MKQLDELYLPMGGLGGQSEKKIANNPKNMFSPPFVLLYFSAPIKLLEHPKGGPYNIRSSS